MTGDVLNVEFDPLKNSEQYQPLIMSVRSLQEKKLIGRRHNFKISFSERGPLEVEIIRKKTNGL